MPEAEQTLTRLKQAGYKLAIISNGGHATRLSILNGLGFQHYFDVINSSGLFGQAKPQADIFIDTAQQLAVEWSSAYLSVIILLMMYKVRSRQECKHCGYQAFMFLQYR
jgi:HAD superfamily hydrolase (TIGR01549 family)